jgi:phage RecT family recombinase
MTEQKAIAPYTKLKNVIQSDNVKERFQDILKDNAPSFLASLLTVATSNKALLNCDPSTLLTAAAKAAILRLPIEQSLGFAYIVPYGSKAEFVLGYKGMIQMALRTSMYEAINATEIYEGEEIVEDRLTGEIEINGQRNGDEVIGFAAYFRLKNGFEKYIYMGVEDMHKHAKKYSKSYGNKSSAWSTDFGAMGKKTVLRALLGKYGMLSIEMLDADDESAPYHGAADPRFETPDDVMVPGFDDILDAELADAVDEIASEDDNAVARAAVESSIIDNAPHALNILSMRDDDCPLGKEEFIGAYIGWKDMGATKEQASKKANAGMLPE